MTPEQYDKLEVEAAEFFADPEPDRIATEELQKASLRTFGKG